METFSSLDYLDKQNAKKNMKLCERGHFTPTVKDFNKNPTLQLSCNTAFLLICCRQM